MTQPPEGFWVCSGIDNCGLLPVSEFNTKSSEGKQTLQSECRGCESKRVKGSNDRVNPKNNAISHEMHRQMFEMGIPRRDHYEEGHKDLRHRLRKEIEADGSWQAKSTEPNKQANPPAPKPTLRSQVRPTKKQLVPEIRWGRSAPRDRAYLEATRNILRRNKWAERETCELSSWGPFNSTQFCHTFHVKDCKRLKEYDWIRDNNNGFLLWEALNPPMERGYHWEMDGPCAFYVPPEGEDYYVWMKELNIHNMWIEPTPEQIKYILLANDYAMGIVF